VDWFYHGNYEASTSVTIGPDRWRYTVRRVTRGKDRDKWNAFAEDASGYVESLGSYPDQKAAKDRCVAHADDRVAIARNFASLRLDRRRGSEP
jgi:hypothetical protein